MRRIGAALGVAASSSALWLALSLDVHVANLVAAGVVGVLAAVLWARARRWEEPTRFRARWLLRVPSLLVSAVIDSVLLAGRAFLPRSLRAGAWIEVTTPPAEGDEETAMRAVLELALSFGPSSAAAASGEGRLLVHVVHDKRDARTVEDLS